jgi:hypothetical protein
MIYLKKTIVQRYEPMSAWGVCTSYLEIGGDLYAMRQVDVYENGNALRYDREHWSDDFGAIGGMKCDAQRWQKAWGLDEKITAAEFEAAWALAERAPNQPPTYRGDAGPWPMLVAEQRRQLRKIRRKGRK